MPTHNDQNPVQRTSIMAAIGTNSYEPKYATTTLNQMLDQSPPHQTYSSSHPPAPALDANGHPYTPSQGSSQYYQEEEETNTWYKSPWPWIMIAVTMVITAVMVLIMTGDKAQPPSAQEALLTEDEIVALQEENTDLLSQLATLEKGLPSDSEADDLLTEKLLKKEEEIKTLQERITALDTAATTNATNLATLEAAKTSAEADAANLRTQLSDVQANLDNANNQVSEIKANRDAWRRTAETANIMLKENGLTPAKTP